jgi:hypothetical protein
VVHDSQCNKKIIFVMNSTFLDLIPMREGSNCIDQFRAIALCIVVYKIITKLIVERLNSWLNSLIFVDQGGFIFGIQILDGIFIA